MAKVRATKSKTQKAPNSDEALLTRGMLTHMFENMKDFMHSSIMASETRTKKEFKADIGRLENAVTSHSKMIKELDVKVTDVRTELVGRMDSMESNFTDVRTELKSEMQDMHTELKSEMQDMHTELKSEMQDMHTELKSEIQYVRTELIEKMDSVESNLTEKIEGQKPILQNHEVRITALEGL